MAFSYEVVTPVLCIYSPLNSSHPKMKESESRPGITTLKMWENAERKKTDEGSSEWHPALPMDPNAICECRWEMTLWSNHCDPRKPAKSDQEDPGRSRTIQDDPGEGTKRRIEKWAATPPGGDRLPLAGTHAPCPRFCLQRTRRTRDPKSQPFDEITEGLEGEANDRGASIGWRGPCMAGASWGSTKGIR